MKKRKHLDERLRLLRTDMQHAVCMAVNIYADPISHGSTDPPPVQAVFVGVSLDP